MDAREHADVVREALNELRYLAKQEYGTDEPNIYAGKAVLAGFALDALVARLEERGRRKHADLVRRIAAGPVSYVGAEERAHSDVAYLLDRVEELKAALWPLYTLALASWEADPLFAEKVELEDREVTLKRARELLEGSHDR